MMSRFTRKLTRLLPALLLCSLGFGVSSCFHDEDPNSVKYKEWREKNELFMVTEEARTMPDGSPYYTRITPSWAPNTYVLIHWHNDRSLTANNLSPMDNSTTKITYELFNVDGQAISSSFANADSVYTSRPSQNIIGMWAGLTHLHVGDTVTMVIPYQAGYGEVQSGNIPPYSTLVYGVKLKSIPAYEVP